MFVWPLCCRDDSDYSPFVLLHFTTCGRAENVESKHARNVETFEAVSKSKLCQSLEVGVRISDSRIGWTQGTFSGHVRRNHTWVPIHVQEDLVWEYTLWPGLNLFVLHETTIDWSLIPTGSSDVARDKLRKMPCLFRRPVWMDFSQKVVTSEPPHVPKAELGIPLWRHSQDECCGFSCQGLSGVTRDDLAGCYSNSKRPLPLMSQSTVSPLRVWCRPISAAVLLTGREKPIDWVCTTIRVCPRCDGGLTKVCAQTESPHHKR